MTLNGLSVVDNFVGYLVSSHSYGLPYLVDVSLNVLQAKYAWPDVGRL